MVPPARVHLSARGRLRQHARQKGAPTGAPFVSGEAPGLGMARVRRAIRLTMSPGPGPEPQDTPLRRAVAMSDLRPSALPLGRGRDAHQSPGAADVPVPSISPLCGEILLPDLWDARP